MKAFLLFLMACTAGFAQDFTVTTTGDLAAKKDSKTDYVVAWSKGISADTLYASAKKYIQAKSAESQTTIKNEDPGKTLIFETKDTPVSTLKKNNEDVVYTASYTTSLEFKDGKTRITYGNINIYTTSAGQEKTNYPLASVYNSKGKVTDVKVKNLIESYFSANAKSIATALKSDGKIAVAEW